MVDVRWWHKCLPDYPPLSPVRGQDTGIVKRTFGVEMFKSRATDAAPLPEVDLSLGLCKPIKIPVNTLRDAERVVELSYCTIPRGDRCEPVTRSRFVWGPDFTREQLMMEIEAAQEHIVGHPAMPHTMDQRVLELQSFKTIRPVITRRGYVDVYKFVQSGRTTVRSSERTRVSTMLDWRNAQSMRDPVFFYDSWSFRDSVLVEEQLNECVVEDGWNGKWQ